MIDPDQRFPNQEFAPESGTQQPKHILVVDDELLIRWSLSQALQHEGFIVATAEDGFQALEQVHRTEFDLILLDIKMAGLDGFEVAERLLAETPSRHIIMMTADATEENINRAGEAGICLLEKPIKLEYVSEQLHHEFS